VIEPRHDVPSTPASICSFMLGIEHWNLPALPESLILFSLQCSPGSRLMLAPWIRSQVSGPFSE